MKNIQKTIPIFYATDDNYIPCLATSLASLIANASKERHYEVNILIEKLREESRRVLEAMATDNVRIRFVPVGERLQAFCHKLHLRDYYTGATYYRFFIPELFPEYDKGVYLDCDVVLTADVAELYKTNVSPFLLAACPDDIVAAVEEFSLYVEAVLGVPAKKYFNAGVLVLNLARMRSLHIEKAFAALLAKRSFKVAQDQDYLNVLCFGRVKLLSPVWNKTPLPLQGKEATPRLLHFKINFKPWHYDGIPYAEVFWQYAAKTPFLDYFRQARASYSSEDIARDEAQYRELKRMAQKEAEEALAAMRDGECLAAAYSVEQLLEELFEPTDGESASSLQVEVL